MEQLLANNLDWRVDGIVFKDAGGDKTGIKELAAGTSDYVKVAKQFNERFKTDVWPNVKLILPPKIKRIFELDVMWRWDEFNAMRKKLKDQGVEPKPGAQEGNEQRRFHGTRMTCDFQGKPCADPKCNGCRIIEGGKLDLDRSGKEAIAKGFKPSFFGDGLYFTSYSHTAKGYGLKDGKKYPPLNMEDFVGDGAGNCILVFSVLCGNVEKISVKPGAASLPDLVPGFHSRVVNKTNGIDELVIFSEAQVMPRFVITFP